MALKFKQSILYYERWSYRKRLFTAVLRARDVEPKRKPIGIAENVQ